MFPFAADLFGRVTLADVAGVIGFVLIAVWPLLRGRRALLGGQAACAVAFALHYGLIGANTGASMMLMSIAQIASVWPEERPLWARTLYAGTFPAMGWVTWSTWAGIASLSAAAGLALSAAGRWRRSPEALRILFLLSGLSWVVHDILTESLQGLCGDLLGGMTLAYGLWRDTARSKTRLDALVADGDCL